MNTHSPSFFFLGAKSDPDLLDLERREPDFLWAEPPLEGFLVVEFDLGFEFTLFSSVMHLGGCGLRSFEPTKTAGRFARMITDFQVSCGSF